MLPPNLGDGQNQDRREKYLSHSFQDTSDRRRGGYNEGRTPKDMELLDYGVEAGVARLTLNRPDKRNALNKALIRDLLDGLERSAEDDAVRIVLLSGAGKDFCSGLDLRELDRGNDAGFDQHVDTARTFAKILLAIRRHPHPVVAAIRGRALGGGAGIATACDLIVAAHSAWIGYPEVKIGFVPAMVSALLRGQVTEKRMFELFATGDSITAHEAHTIGLINRVFPDSDFTDSCEAYVHGIVEKSASALSLTKRLLYDTDAMNFETALEAAVHANARARMTDDAKRGFERFLKKD